MSTLKTAIISVATICLAGIVLLFIVLFFINSNTESIAAIQDDINTRNTTAGQVGRVEKQLEQIGPNKDILLGHILPDADIVKVIEGIEAIGKDNNINVTISSLVADDSTNAPVGTINKVKARVDGRGSWKSVLMLIDRVEAMPYKINISNISIKQDGTLEKTKLPGWNTSFQVEIIKIK